MPGFALRKIALSISLTAAERRALDSALERHVTFALAAVSSGEHELVAATETRNTQHDGTIELPPALAGG